MNTTKAVVVDPAAPGRFVIREFPSPQATPNQAIVRVKAISINRGEVRYSMSAPAGRRPGWDLAGIVEKSAADGTGPKEGSRVVGMVALGSWSQLVAVPTDALAELPGNVSFEVAATLPVAGLTALHSLYKGGFLVGKKLLITGATGGTGDFTIQLAKLGGATVVALTRSKDREPIVRQFGADHVIVGDDLSPAGLLGPYDLIVDSVGGSHFGKTMEMLAPRGVHVIFGATAGGEVSFNASKFYATGAASLYGLIIFNELKREPASIGLKILSQLVASGKLSPRIDLVESWTQVAELATTDGPEIRWEGGIAGGVGFDMTVKYHADTMLTRQSIHGQRDAILEIARRYGASEVRIIGSVARGDATDVSDLDLIVRFEPGRSLLDHGGLVMDLRELLGTRVDVIDEEAMRPRFRQHVMKEAIPL